METTEQFTPLVGNYKDYQTFQNLQAFANNGHTKTKITATDSLGNIIFDKDEIEHPSSWSEKAIYIFASKFLKKVNGKFETSIYQTVNRIATELKKEIFKQLTKEDGERLYTNISHILLNQIAAFNSPVWFNLGADEKGFLSACFILSIEDSIEGIMRNACIEAEIFKWGAGSGKNWNGVRSSYESLSSGGSASGPTSFMRGFDAFAGVIKSGGRHRRAAKMDILPIEHPDIIKTKEGAAGFIPMKIIEDEKARVLANNGYSTNFETPNNCYSGSWYQNSNIAISVSNEFMNAAIEDKEFQTKEVITKKPVHTYRAQKVLTEIATAVWSCGDPGIFFDDTINNWHTCKSTDRIYSSNPCAEYVFLNDSSCNLASINLIKMIQGKTKIERRHKVTTQELWDKTSDGRLIWDFKTNEFCDTVTNMITAQEAIVNLGIYPTSKIKENSINYRPLGLGYANLGALLMTIGIPYDSDVGRHIAGAITSLMTATAYETSALLAKEKGAFAGYEKNRASMLNVINKHINAHNLLFEYPPITYLDYGVKEFIFSIIEEATRRWLTALELGKRYGYRNAQVTLLAPTGTIRLIMDCDTSGVEPLDGLISYKYLVEGTTLEFTPECVTNGMRTLGYDDSNIHIATKHIEENKSLKDCIEIKEEHLSVFATALGDYNTIEPSGHMKMLGVIQPFLSGAISKTVNLPNSYTINDIYNSIIEAWKLGIKVVTFYRDGSKMIQPVKVAKKKPNEVSQPKRKKLPSQRNSKTCKINIGGMKGYVIFGEYDNGTLGEVFVVISKIGSTIQGLLNQWAVQVSLSLQHGTPIESIISKEKNSKYEPYGLTNDGEYKLCTSITDYISRLMERHYNKIGNIEQETAQFNNLSKPCPDCGSMMPRIGMCYTCPACGHNSGCA